MAKFRDVQTKALEWNKTLQGVRCTVSRAFGEIVVRVRVDNVLAGEYFTTDADDAIGTMGQMVATARNL